MAQEGRTPKDFSSTTGMLGLMRLTRAMNGQDEPAADDSPTLGASADSNVESLPYSTAFVRTLLNYAVGGAPESKTADALGVDGVGVLPSYTGILFSAAERIGMSDDDLAEINRNVNPRPARIARIRPVTGGGGRVV